MKSDDRHHSPERDNVLAGPSAAHAHSASDQAAQLAARCKGDPAALAHLIAEASPGMQGAIVTAAQQLYGNEFVNHALHPKKTVAPQHGSSPSPPATSGGATTSHQPGFVGARGTHTSGDVTLAGSIGAGGSAHAQAGVDNTGAGAEGSVGVKGSATKGHSEVHEGVGADGNIGAHAGTGGFGANAGAFAGAKAGGSTAGGITHNGKEAVGGRVGAEGMVGFGANAGGHMDRDKDGGYTIGGNVGAAFGIGGGVSGEIHIGGRGKSEDNGGGSAPDPKQAITDAANNTGDAAQNAANSAGDAAGAAADGAHDAANQGSDAVNQGVNTVKSWF